MITVDDLSDDRAARPRGYGACAVCGTEWTGTRICHCGTCHLTFTAVGSFDAHRSRGHCLTTDELRSRGYQPNDAGHWRIPAPAGTFTGRTT